MIRLIYKLIVFMCMNINKHDLIRINNGFGGNLRNEASLDFALEIQNNIRYGEYQKLAYFMRAILVDHMFTDGNKRTALYVALAFSLENNKYIDKELLLHHILSITKNNENNITNIIWRLKNAIK